MANRGPSINDLRKKFLGEDQMTTGGYVNDPPYLEMRLRMLLTGTASPTDEQWGKALKGLLHHLDDNVCPACHEVIRKKHPACGCVG